MRTINNVNWNDLGAKLAGVHFCIIINFYKLINGDFYKIMFVVIFCVYYVGNNSIETRGCGVTHMSSHKSGCIQSLSKWR